MASSESSVLGISRQAAKGTAATNGFKYVLFSRGQAGVQNMTIPLDMEVGGGAMLRDVVKVGVTGGGALEFTPRPDSLGSMLLGATGNVESTAIDTGGTRQVETATVVAAGGCTSNGSATVTVTSANMIGSPDTIQVPLTTAAHTTAALIAAAMRAALATDLNLLAAFTIGGTGANVVLTSRNALANDATLNIAIATGTAGGITAAPTSADTTAGVAGTGQGVYSHVFTLGADQFVAPYYTARIAPAKLWGETIPDCRFNMLGLQWRGANFVRGQMGFVGGTPVPVADASTWGAQADVDQTPPFITPVSAIEMPSGTNMKVMGGSFVSTMAIPLEEQWVVGSYSPDDFDIVQRAFMLQLAVKITDANLYNAMMYDGLNYANAWSAEILKQANFNIVFNTAAMAAGATPYSLTIEGNGGAAGSGNVAWSAQPIGLRAGSQVLMNVTGVFLADATLPIRLTLVNRTANYNAA